MIRTWVWALGCLPARRAIGAPLVALNKYLVNGLLAKVVEAFSEYVGAAHGRRRSPDDH